MPTTDPLFLLGYTIVIYIGFVFVDSVVGFLYVWGGYNLFYVITFYNIKIKLKLITMY
jgi:hypothetical protein